MSTKSITENIALTISKGPLVVFLVLGFGFWQLSKMTKIQVDTIERLLAILSSSKGPAVIVVTALVVIVLLLLIYALMLYPLGRFAASFTREIVELQKVHNNQHAEHVEASKNMYHTISKINSSCEDMHHKIDKFYGGND